MNTYKITTVYADVEISGRSLPETMMYTRQFETDRSLESMTELAQSIYQAAQSITVEQVS